MPYKVFSYKVVIWIVTQCVFWKIECDNPNNVAAWMRFLDGSNFEKILRKTWTRGTWPEAIMHHTDRDWQAKIIVWKCLASFHPNVINVFFFFSIFACFFWTQEPTPLTEDMLEEQAEILTQLGTSEEGARVRAQMQCASLLSDMEAFKVG